MNTGAQRHLGGVGMTAAKKEEQREGKCRRNQKKAKPHMDSIVLGISGVRRHGVLSVRANETGVRPPDAKEGEQRCGCGERTVDAETAMHEPRESEGLGKDPRRFFTTGGPGVSGRSPRC